ncbi:MAG: glycoside hydrolase domain-containing protein [Acidobacteriaceae bacterium]
MKRRFVPLLVLALLLPAFALAQKTSSAAQKTYLGFDKNIYPGDALLSALHKTFAYTGYWLNNPPGETANTWVGKRALLKAHGFGFLVLFNGRLDEDIQRSHLPPAQLGEADAARAVAAATREGFPAGTVLFLDQEEGGRLLPEQAEYLFAWVDGVQRAGYRTGVYCSGIRVHDGKDWISTADDIHARAAGRKIALWVVNDACPPSPGCVVPGRSLHPAESGIADALVWQYAQSPKRQPFARRCGGYSKPDNACYAPGLPHSAQTFLDFNTSTSADPSSGK